MAELETAYLVGGTRTPIGRYAGALAPVRPDDLAALPIRALLDSLPDSVESALEEVVLGCANQAGEDCRNVARMSSLLAGVSESVPGVTLNKLCGSGLAALVYAARGVWTGDLDLVLAGGVESMSRAPLVIGKAEGAYGRDQRMWDSTIGWRFDNPALEAMVGTDSMPETAENVAAEFGISREDQDAFALRSQQRAAAAQASGRLSREITPVTVKTRRAEAVVEADEHPRETSAEKLAALRAPFRKDGTVTAGNASGVNDGAAALLVASAAAVEEHGLRPLARITAAASAGVPPRIMGIGPVPATRKLMERKAWRVADLDLIEVNEAFASQSLAVLRELGLPDDAQHVNPNGGAIALGHPLGMSGARLVLTAATELADRGGEKALVTMCIGVGQGIAVSLEAA